QQIANNQRQAIDQFSHIRIASDEIDITLRIHMLNAANICLRSVGSIDASKDNWYPLGSNSSTVWWDEIGH
ncbi:MAG: hypothetical protein ACJAYB_002592, partial [Psychromonas sp.]